MRSGALLVTALSLLQVAPAVGASPSADLERARRAYQELEFERCLRELNQAARRYTSAGGLAQVELYRGLCSAGVNDTAAALSHFKLARQLDAAVSLPVHTAPKVVALFDAAAPPRATPPPDSPRKVELQPVPPARPAEVIQPVPRHPLRPFVFVAGGAATAAGVAALIVGLQARKLETSANSATYADEHVRLGAEARRAAQTSNVCTGAAVAAGVAGLVLLLLDARTVTGSP